MYAAVGIVILIVMVFGGFALTGGALGPVLHALPHEMLIIGGAAIAATEIIPELKGNFDGLAVRVPTPVGSLSDMVFVTKRPTSVEEVNRVLEEATHRPELQGIMAVTHEPIVSSDIVGRRESSIVDLALTQVIGGNLVKVVSWYDNEFGYCNRLIEQVTRA